MKWIVEEKKQVINNVIPKVGQYWRHKGGFNVYQRIDVKSHLGDSENEFYSIDESSSLWRTTINPRQTGIELLKVSNCQGDRLIFVPE